MSAKIYLEGGGDSKELNARCREGFRKLLEGIGLSGHRARLSASGGRTAAFEEFKIAHARRRSGDYVAMLIDSEDPVANIEAPWLHVQQRDGWQRPSGAHDDQVLLMTTCMETWVVADRATLARHYGTCLQNSALPPRVDLEGRERADIQRALVRATRSCSKSYAKGPRSFEILGKLDANVLEQHLPSFARMRAILTQK